VSDLKLALEYNKLPRGHKAWTSVSSSVKENLLAYIYCTILLDLL
jgi:hypothetical protein